MAKRFHDTDIWNEDWYLEMPIEYMKLWDYIKDTCDHAGIWRPNRVRFELLVKRSVDLEEGIKYFNNGKERIRILSNGRWFIVGFIIFQYGSSLNPNNRVHNSILKLLEVNGVNLNSIRGQQDLTQGLKDKDKDKDKDNIGARRKFTPPTIEEVIEYCRERKNGIKATTFIDFYESKNWMVGKNKMTKWRAAIRTWEQRDGNEPKKDKQPTGRSPSGMPKYTKPDPKEQSKVADLISKTVESLGKK